ncbi:hypothetical protein MYSTI_01797 [Myxococcus stipitatus DSM 14675]|uniref:Uncharacterized protein n=1 Tax=Myxococcus stipitatus (strain DSM 14675 / JCM 12634 / Mx s8) TaxID=1278073 RepID=L7U9I7_MYXSD|nr:PAAR-like domain-containing protein [Myxococcus stipitatus]AGC43129.1 hypothetical protein MYSTI_01797 [Myxococcus stipitatus DSM 14675]
MPTVAVNSPKTPAHKGSNGVAAATVPNVCKMPGPPAPFVPTPLPNIGRSGEDPKGYTTRVTVEGQPVAISGASFGSQGDVASKGTGGGLISSNTHGPTKFVGPGSMDVKFEGKNVHLLGDPMLNNCGPSGSPANAATMMGLVQGILVVPKQGDGDLNCPHPNLQYDDVATDSTRRQELDQKIQSKGASSERHFADAIVAEGAGNTAVADKLLEVALEHERQSKADAFEKFVGNDTHAKEVSKKFHCPDCLMDGEIDVVTGSGVVKECKTGKPKLKQLEKIASASAVIFPGAPVHLAIPKGMKIGTPWPQSQIQEH